jgi:hypothetical protein
VYHRCPATEGAKASSSGMFTSTLRSLPRSVALLILVKIVVFLRVAKANILSSLIRLEPPGTRRVNQVA